MTAVSAAQSRLGLAGPGGLEIIEESVMVPRKSSGIGPASVDSKDNRVPPLPQLVSRRPLCVAPSPVRVGHWGRELKAEDQRPTGSARVAPALAPSYR